MTKMENTIPKCFYRVSTKGLVVRDGKILLIQEKDGRWELPGGGLEFDQDIFDSLKREFVEEMGVNIIAITKRAHVCLEAKEGKRPSSVCRLQSRNRLFGLQKIG